MYDYDAVIEQIDSTINYLHRHRDAQRADSHRFEHFQREIDRRTDQLIEWRQVVPELEQLDARIKVARSAARSAQREADGAMDMVWRAAKVFGGLGIVFLLVTVLWNPNWWCPVLTFVFIVVAVGAIVYGTRIRQGRYEAVDEADDRVAVLEAQKAARMPATPTGLRQREPLGALFAEVEDVDELVPVDAD